MKKEKDLNKVIHIESVLFSVLDDLKEYLDDLVLVGGWLPSIYIDHLWKGVKAKPVTTTDIDLVGR